jgi:hypothetical protein
MKFGKIKRYSIPLAVLTFSVLAIAGMAIGGLPIVTDLNGQQEVSVSGGDPDGTGSAEIQLNIGQHQVCWEISYENIVSPTAAHIHKASEGVNGPIVIPLSPIGNGCITILTPTPGAANSVIQDIIINPEQYYINVHNSDFPAGAIRGQLRRGQ